MTAATRAVRAGRVTPGRCRWRVGRPTCRCRTAFRDGGTLGFAGKVAFPVFQRMLKKLSIPMSSSLKSLFNLRVQPFFEPSYEGMKKVRTSSMLLRIGTATRVVFELDPCRHCVFCCKYEAWSPQTSARRVSFLLIFIAK